MVVLVPEPVMPPGLIVHVPDEGNPLRTTLPVLTEQVGGVMVPTEGADGMGCTVTVTDWWVPSQVPIHGVIS
jgi:hypothetical protein